MDPLKENSPTPAVPVVSDALKALEAEGGALDKEKNPALEAQEAAAATAQAGALAEWEGLVSQLGLPVSDVFAPNWGVSAAEWNALGRAWAPVLNEYFPEGVTTMGPWPGAILCTAMVMAPRLGKPLRLPQPDKPEEGGDVSNN